MDRSAELSEDAACAPTPRGVRVRVLTGGRVDAVRMHTLQTCSTVKCSPPEGVLQVSLNCNSTGADSRASPELSWVDAASDVEAQIVPVDMEREMGRILQCRDRARTD